MKKEEKKYVVNETQIALMIAHWNPIYKKGWKHADKLIEKHAIEAVPAVVKALKLKVIK